MGDLTQLLLASKDLFLSLSTQKIKTLQQAEQLLKQKDPPRAKEIKQVLQNFAKLQHQVQTSFKSHQSCINISPQNPFDSQLPLAYYHSKPSIIEIIGAKGSGKTALALKLTLQFIQKQSLDRVILLNCSGGITYARFLPIAQQKATYFDVFTIQELQQLLKGFANDRKAGLLTLDGAYNLLIASSLKTRVGELLTQLRVSGWSVIFTNLTQGKLEMEEKEVLNTMAYFPNTFGGLADCRLSITPAQNGDNLYRILALKHLDCKKYRFASTMTPSGLTDLQLLR